MRGHFYLLLGLLLCFGTAFALNYYPNENGQFIVRIESAYSQPVPATCLATILYPDKTYFLINQSMNQSPTQNYYIEFIVPSTLGVYETLADCDVNLSLTRSMILHQSGSFKVEEAPIVEINLTNVTDRLDYLNYSINELNFSIFNLNNTFNSFNNYFNSFAWNTTQNLYAMNQTINNINQTTIETNTTINNLNTTIYNMNSTMNEMNQTIYQINQTTINIANNMTTFNTTIFANITANITGDLTSAVKAGNDDLWKRIRNLLLALFSIR